MFFSFTKEIFLNLKFLSCSKSPINFKEEKVSLELIKFKNFKDKEFFEIFKFVSKLNFFLSLIISNSISSYSFCNKIFPEPFNCTKSFLVTRSIL